MKEIYKYLLLKFNMDNLTIIVGFAAIVYGFYTALLHFIDPLKLGKLSILQGRWGKKTGLVIHIFFYTIFPIFFGVSLLIACFTGLSIYEIIRTKF